MPRSNKALVTFTAGEWSPSKDARADLEKASAALRTCRNMIVDRYGGVFRRPGLKFISAVKSFAAISYVSYEGSATLYGITEYGNLTDPPQKYLISQSLNGVTRYNAGFTTVPFPNFIINNIDTADTEGVYWRYNAATGSATRDGYSWASGGAGTRAGLTTGATAKRFSLEDIDWSASYAGAGAAEWVPYWNQGEWTREKTRKYWAAGDLTSPSGEGDHSVDLENPISGNSPQTFGAPLIYYGQNFGFQGTVGTSVDVRIMAMTWTGTHYAMKFYVGGDGVTGVGTASPVALYISVINGNQDPGDPSGSNKVYLGETNSAANSTGGVQRVFTLALPPGTSFALAAHRTGGGATLAEGTFPNRLWTTYGYDKWIYLPDPTNGETAFAPIYEERLFDLNPYTDILEDASGTVVGTEEWAQTTSIAGGTAAGSHTAITYTARTVKATYTLTGLTVGNTYPVTLTYQERDIGGGNTNSLQEVVSVVASSATEQFTQEVIAEAGRERKLINATAGVGVAPVVVTTLEGETLLWNAKLLAAGKTATSTEITAVDNFFVAVKANSLLGYMRYVLPFVGNDIAAAMIPIYDRNGEGSAVNAGSFVDGDRSSLGLSGNGTSKYLTVPFRFNNLGGQSSGWRWGAGAKITRHSFAGTSGGWNLGIWNAAPNQAYGVRPSFKDIQLNAGTFGHAATYSHEATNGDNILGSVSSDTSRKIFLDGALVATATSTTNSSDAGYTDILVFGDNLGGTRYYAGSMSVVYFTTGTLSDADNIILQGLIDDLHTDLGRTVSAEEPALSTWLDRMTINSGTLTSNSLTYATDLFDDLKAWSGFSKMMYVIPLLGSNLAAIRVPLIDRDIRGLLTNTGYADGDVNEAVGMVGAGSSGGTKYLLAPYNPAELGTSNNGGMGWREVNSNVANQQSWQPMGSATASTDRYTLNLKGTSPYRRDVQWGADTNVAGDTTLHGNNHYYGQRSSATLREMFENAVSVGTNTTSDAGAGGTSAGDIYILAIKEGANIYRWHGTCGLAYLTNGELTAQEVTDLHTIVEAFITATGR